MNDEPNLFQFSGADLQVSYSTSGFDGEPQFTYHDSNQSKAFSGKEIKAESTELGTLVSVVVRQTVDAGSTVFSVVIPSFGPMPASGGVSISTVGITTVHKIKVFGQEPGQSSFSTIKTLQGTGLSVIF